MKEFTFEEFLVVNLAWKIAAWIMFLDFVQIITEENYA